jgi:mono/diheme cytochrome c family protein
MWKKILFGLLGLIVLVVVGFYIFVQTSWNKTYDIPYPDLQATTDSAVIAHGEYLVRGPAHCVGCHVASFDDMIQADRGEYVALQGGVRFPLGPLGTISPANLTPDTETGIGRYEDGEIFRMMRHAVKPNGMATLTPMMPFYNMADDDLVAVVSYLRSAEPVHNPVADPEWTFLGKFVKSTASVFKPVLDPNPPAKAPAMAPTIERGEYLARYVANCVGCHTPRNVETFEPIGPDFSGGMEFEPFPELHRALGVDEDLWARSPNLTPHPNSALMRYNTVEAWIDRFRQGRAIQQSPMDWGAFGKMTDADLEAIWKFLNTLDPVENDIVEVVYKKEE